MSSYEAFQKWYAARKVARSVIQPGEEWEAALEWAKSGQEPLMYQSRMQPMWTDRQPWTVWGECTKGTYNDYKRVPENSDWRFESRALFLHPAPAQPVRLSEDDLKLMAHEIRLHDDWDGRGDCDHNWALFANAIQDAMLAKGAAQPTEAPVVDLKHIAYDALCEAAGKSKWIPKEYWANDWLADCRDFLINGQEQTTPAQPVRLSDEEVLELWHSVKGFPSEHTTREFVSKIQNAMLAKGAAQTAVAQHPDDEAVDRFALALKEKLALAREKGRSGWQQMGEEELSRMLREHVEKGDPRDVANFCMFLWDQGKGIVKSNEFIKDSELPWLCVIDEEMVGAHLGVANESDTYEQAKAKLNSLICWHTDVATNPKVNGGDILVPFKDFKNLIHSMEHVLKYGEFLHQLHTERARETYNKLKVIVNE